MSEQGGAIETRTDEIVQAERRGYLACMEQTQKFLGDLLSRQPPPPIIIQGDTGKDALIKQLREVLVAILNERGVYAIQSSDLELYKKTSNGLNARALRAVDSAQAVLAAAKIGRRTDGDQDSEVGDA